MSIVMRTTSLKGVMNMDQNTKYAARATQVERQVEKKTYTHDTDSKKQANRQGRCVRETEAIIGKAPRLGIHTSEEPTQRLSWCGPDSMWNMRGQHQCGIKDIIISLCACCDTHVHR